LIQYSHPELDSGSQW